MDVLASKSGLYKMYRKIRIDIAETIFHVQLRIKPVNNIWFWIYSIIVLAEQMENIRKRGLKMRGQPGGLRYFKGT